MREGLVVLEVALAFVLAIGSALVVREISTSGEPQALTGAVRAARSCSSSRSAACAVPAARAASVNPAVALKPGA